MIYSYVWAGHKINVKVALSNYSDSGYGVTCETCSVPYVIAKAINLMVDCCVKKLSVDGQLITLVN